MYLVMKKPITYQASPQAPQVMRDRLALPGEREVAGPTGMVRTQIYLTRGEHAFVSAEALRRGEPMAAIIREYIDEKMRVPDTVWESNPMLVPTPKDARFDLPEDAAINHDHYLYGAPKKYLKKRGQWVLAAPQPEP